MSAVEGTGKPKSEGVPRRRRNRGPRRNGGGGGGGRGASEAAKSPRSDGETPRERERTPPIETAPVPRELLGTTVEGRISDVIRKGKGRFGFINIGDNVKPQADVPRIFFPLSEYSNETHPPRRGFHVSFKVTADDQDRFFGSEVALTAAGEIDATEDAARRQANLAAIEDERALKKGGAAARALADGTTKSAGGSDAAGAAGARAEGARKRRPKKVDDRVVAVKVHFASKPGVVKDYEAKLGKPLSVFKKDVAALFEETGDFALYGRVTPENPAGELLNNKLLKGLGEGEVVIIGPAIAK